MRGQKSTDTQGSYFDCFKHCLNTLVKEFYLVKVDLFSEKRKGTAFESLKIWKLEDLKCKLMGEYLLQA